MEVKANPAAIAARQKDGQHIDQRAMRIERMKQQRAEQWRNQHVVNQKYQKGEIDICTIWKGTVTFAVCAGVGAFIGVVTWFGYELLTALKTFL